MPTKEEKKAKTPRARREPRYFYSKATGGFYIEGVHADIPADAEAMSKDDHEQLFRDLNDDPSNCVASDDNGRPVIRKRPEGTREEYEQEIDAALSALFRREARDRGYTDAATLASYALSTNADYKAEAEAFIAWRDEACSVIYSKLADIPDGGRPSADVVLNNVPKFELKKA